MVRLTMPAQIDFLQEFCGFVRRGAEAVDLAPQEMDKLDLVLEELFVNIARYAYAPGQGEVEVGYAAEGPGRLRVELSDWGRAFNPLASDPPDFSRGVADRPLGGMGIFLVRTIADSICYERDGNVNRISFSFSGPVQSRAPAGSPNNPP
jgi:serine/threonine-protein kinase RsbW